MRKTRLVAGPLASVLVAGLLSLGVAAPAEAAKGYVAVVKCTKIRISDNSGQGHVVGKGKAKTESAAWKAAIKNANNQMPTGYRAKHCTKKSIEKA
ncbi:hypothetical protein [Streptomyces boncukensis]|uniref:Secreted protein n=1 Tax=Streptomyces boncukensis TaxID=2711219 RepID=A0A6G4WY22_9ACTN|nr:hypothetical protein [Streptomyces boncukensis]NGO70186.1 hypothetical protein [Streptomyces boncukensis]